jgi:RNA polymerase sigma-70 factor (ECF subfamily)
MAEILEKIAIRHSRSLIEKSQTGDEHAYGKLVGLWFKRIYNFSLKYFGDHDLAMEVSQQTFIVAFNKLPKLRDPESFNYWIYKIVLNHCREEDRRQKRRRWYSMFINEEAKQYESDFGNPELEYHQSERKELLADYLRRLPDEQKTVIIMKEYDNMKFREIAKTLDISENTVKSRLYYGLSALRKMMENSELKIKS